MPEESEESGKKKEEEEVAVNSQCVKGFAIRVDRGNNTKGGFDKKLSEGLTSAGSFSKYENGLFSVVWPALLPEFLHISACILSKLQKMDLQIIRS